MAAELKLEIPEALADGLAALFRLSDEQISVLQSELQQAKPRLSRAKFLEDLAGKIPTDPPAARAIAEALLSMYLARASFEVRAERFVEGVLSAAQEAEDERLHFEAAEASKIKDRLVSLLTEQSLAITSKAFDVMTEHERTYTTGRARILTDLRPIYGDEPTAPPSTAVVVHNLKITYHERGGIREFYVAMDTDDLLDLKDAIERAQQKEQGLMALLKPTNLEILSPTPEE